MPRPPSVPEVKIAKITSLQAIAVALITAIASILGTLLAAHHSDPVPGHWHTMTVDQVTYTNAEPKTAIRLVLEINGQAYSYPSRTLWSDIGGNISPESFPLPPSPSGYKVHFEAYLRHPDGTIKLLQSQVLDSVPESSIPFAGSYQLHVVDEGFSRGWIGEDVVALRYRVE